MSAVFVGRSTANRIIRCSIPFEASDFAFVLLNKTLKSSTLRLAFIYVVVFSAAVFGLLGYVYWSTVGYLYEKSDRVISMELDLLTKAYDAGGRNRLVQLINQRLTDAYFSQWVYLLADPSFNYVAGNRESWPVALRSVQGWSTNVSFDRAGPLRVTNQMLPDGYHLLLGYRIDELDRFAENVWFGLAAAAALFLILAAAAGISTSRRSVARIETINATSRAIMRSGLGERIPLRGTGDEWDGLAENLNSMLDRIEELVETNRQVSDNIAHDLRTPLTRMRGRLERACNQELDVSCYQALVNDTIGELDVILTTFSSLLRISQIEARARTAGFRPIDLTAIVREVAELFEPAAEESRVRLKVDARDLVPAVGDRDLLFDAISNLVDNAIKHGGEHGEVGIAVSADVNGPVLAITDCGPGIPIEERKQVLRRFYRLERSRNSPGNGLGLSLVAAVADLHGARLTLTDNAPGLRVELHFPLLQRSIHQRPQPSGEIMAIATALAMAASLAFSLGLPVSNVRAQYYLGGQAGWSGLPYQTDTIDGLAAIPVSFNAGYNLGARGGYRLGPWRFEGEYSYRHNNVAEYGDASMGVNGARHTQSILTNVIYDFDVGWPITPHVGVGIGAMNVSDRLSVPATEVFLSGSGWQFGYQAIAGLRYDLNTLLSLDLDYRYLATTESMFRIPNSKLHYRTGDNTNNFVAGLTYRFAPSLPTDPPATTAPPSP
jgi:signal transduction histidine kinase/opacity protein-like surface antigen